MRVARLHDVGDVRLHEEETPLPADGDVLVRVDAVGICGSDLHWFGEGGIGDSALKEPLVLGHELAGTVQGGELAGRLVAVDPAIACETCASCRRGLRHLCTASRFAGHGTVDGGLREVIAWPARLLHPLPESLTAEDGAMLEPLGVAIHATDLAHFRVGDAAIVVGCGPIGLLLVQVARVSGATNVVAVDPLAHRRALALEVGADAALTPDEALADFAMDPAGGFERVFDAAGDASALDVAVRAAAPGARVVLVGIPADDRTAFPAAVARRKGLTLLVCRRMNEVYERSIDLVAQGRVDVRSVVSHRFPLGDIERAFTTARDRTGHKVIVLPNGEVRRE